MDECKTYQQQIALFQNNNLSYKDEKKFVEHVMDCEYCKEEFEIYCIIEYGLNDYDENQIHPQYLKYLNILDYKGLVDQRLKDRLHYLKWFKENEKLTNCVTLFTNAMLIFVLIVLIIIKFF